MNKLQEIINAVKSEAGNEYLYFSEPVRIKLNGHFGTFHIWGARVSPDNVLYVMDADLQWEKVENLPIDLVVIHYLYERVKTIPEYQNVVTVL
jgi:hypothetical protein